MKALVISPYTGEIVLESTSTLARVCTEALKKESFNVDTLEGAEAKRKNLPKGKKYDLIFFAGHGKERSLLGSDGRAIFDDNNIEYAEGAIIIAIACKAGRWLSMSATSKGARAFWGFRDICYLPNSSEKHAYLSDFIRTLSVPLLSLLEGYSIFRAVTEFQSLAREYASSYEENDFDAFAGIMHAWMLFNEEACVFQGAPNATLGEEALVVKWSP